MENINQTSSGFRTRQICGFFVPVKNAQTATKFCREERDSGSNARMHGYGRVEYKNLHGEYPRRLLAVIDSRLLMGGTNQTSRNAIVSNITILSKEIRLHNGLYNLNDLHKAAGNEAKHKPSNFLRLDQTQELIQEINQCSDLSIKKSRTPNLADDSVKIIRGGSYRGTYVCEELLLAYAMWVSAKIHLLAIRALKQKYIGQNQTPNSSFVSKPPAITQPETLTIVTTIKPGQTPQSHTIQGDVLIIPRDTFQEHVRKTSVDFIHNLNSLDQYRLQGEA